MRHTVHDRVALCKFSKITQKDKRRSASNLEVKNAQLNVLQVGILPPGFDCGARSGRFELKRLVVVWPCFLWHEYDRPTRNDERQRLNESPSKRANQRTLYVWSSAGRDMSADYPTTSPTLEDLAQNGGDNQRPTVRVHRNLNDNTGREGWVVTLKGGKKHRFPELFLCISGSKISQATLDRIRTPKGELTSSGARGIGKRTVGAWLLGSVHIAPTLKKLPQRDTIHFNPFYTDDFVLSNGDPVKAGTVAHFKPCGTVSVVIG